VSSSIGVEYIYLLYPSSFGWS